MSLNKISDTRRLSPQTTSSSGYHSDLSSTNESPQLTNENISSNIDQPTLKISKKTLTNKDFSRISSFIRKQYERAKSKFLSQKSLSIPRSTCSKATSTTPLSFLLDKNYSKTQQFLPSNYKQSSFIEPIYSIYVQPIYDNLIKTHTNSQQLSNNSFFYPKPNNNQMNSRHLTTITNSKNSTNKYLLNNSHIYYHPNYSIKPIICQNSYPYKYLKKNSDCNQLLYAPLSDFISTRKSAFKPFKFFQRPLPHKGEQIPSSDDPCDLEVEQYFYQTSQWSNPNYFDIYTKQISTTMPKQTYKETLC